MKLESKVAVITGGASGIGAACAKAFAQSGARVAVVDVNLEGATSVAKTVEGIAIHCDLADASAIDAMVQTVESQLGPIDLLFNNAGIGSGSDIFASPVDEWQRQWDVNLMSHVHAVRAVLPGMLDRGEGYLLHTASMAGILSSHGNLPYAVSKHAVVGLAEWLSFTYAHRGIGVSLLAPRREDPNVGGCSRKRVGFSSGRADKGTRRCCTTSARGHKRRPIFGLNRSNSPNMDGTKDR